MSTPEPHRSGFVTVVGRPNAGKSTLLNALVGQKVAIVSDKPQTTRNKIQCVYTRPGLQIVFLDTPGIHKPRHRLGERMVEITWATLAEVDAILFLVDVAQPLGGGDRFIAQRLLSVHGQAGTPIVLGLNKVDLVAGSLAERRAEYEALGPFSEVVELSAVQGRNLHGLIAALAKHMPEGPQYYPDDWVTDHPEQFIVAELIREKVLHLTREEIPHAVAVVVDEMGRRSGSDLVDIHATLYVERPSQQGILIGKGGQMLKQIGQLARAEIEALLGSRVNLQLWVKTRADWRDDESWLTRLGYERGIE